MPSPFEEALENEFIGALLDLLMFLKGSPVLEIIRTNLPNGIEYIAKNRIDLLQGKADDQYQAALNYEKGNMQTGKNNANAACWFRKAAAQGHEASQYRLGQIYEEGIGVLKDPAEARFWYLKAANQGNPLAQEAIRRLGEK